ncbi:MAG TPA: hypothetical protein V6D06_10045 [Trichocoleus sp.]
MTSALQATIIALLISLLIGFLIGYSLRQGRIGGLSQALKQSQKRNEELEREHELRLQEATAQLQRDYESQLAEKIERYQDQIEERTALLEQEYQGRLAVVEQGRQGADAGFTPALEAISTTEPAVGISPEIQYVEQQVKRQYENRLKEAAHKIQQAYEQHLRQKLRENRDLMQKDYENRLAQKIEHYEQQLATQMEQLQSDYELRLQALRPAVPPTPGWETTMTMSPMQPPLPVADPPLAASEVPGDVAMQELEAQLRQEYEQKLAEKIEHYQDDLAQRVQSLEAEYEARLQVQPPQMPIEDSSGAADVDVAAIEERLRQEYEQKLAEKIEHYQDDLSQRVESLESEYETRLQVAQQAQPLPEASPESSPGPSLDATIVNIEVTELSYREESPASDTPELGVSELGASEFDASEFGALDLGASGIGTDELDIAELDAFVSDLPDPESATSEAEPGVPSESPFSLDDILATAAPTGLDEGSLPLEGAFDAEDFNLDELLFEETPEAGSDDLPPDLDDISRLS